MNKILKEDIDYITQNFIFDENIKDKSILITGSNGLIGSLIIHSLVSISYKKNLNLKIMILTRTIEKTKKKFLDYNLIYVEGDMKNNNIFEGLKVDYIIHAASPTQSFFLSNNPVETIEQNVLGAFNVISLARKNNARLLFISSIEVYGENNTDDIIKEDNMKGLNSLVPRNGYPESKKLIECLLKAYNYEYGTDIVICRLTQTFGAGASLSDERIFSYIANCIIDKNDIYLKTTGESSKSYIYSADAVLGIFYILFKGVSGECYNLCNPNTYMSIYDMCNLAVKTTNSTIKIYRTSSKNNTLYASSTKINMDSSKINNLGFHAKYDMSNIFRRYIDYLKMEKKL